MSHVRDAYNDYSNEETYSHRPICRCCGEPIASDKAYDIDGLYCQSCFEFWVESIQVYMD